MALLDFLWTNWAILLVPLLGLAAIYLLLPRPRRAPVLYGAGAAGLALLLSALFIVRVGELATATQYIEAFLFYAFAGTAIVAGGLLVTQENPARAALSFALVVLATSGLFLLQAGPFLMAATIIVYAGAIIVTFLFVIMLSQQQGLSDADARSREPFLASMTGFLLLIALLYILKITYKPDLDCWVERTREKLNAVEEFANQPQPDTRDALTLVADVRQFIQEYRAWLSNDRRSGDGADSEKATLKSPPPHTKGLQDALTNAESALPFSRGPKDEETVYEERVTVWARNGDRRKLLQERLTALVAAGEETRNNPLVGQHRPTQATRLSEGSGPRSSRPLTDLRRDEEGRPHLPAENTTYLGRSLFTDYLLAVELAGTLLLVATIGAIAIAQRRDDDRLSPADGTIPRRNA